MKKINYLPFVIFGILLSASSYATDLDEKLLTFLQANIDKTNPSASFDDTDLPISTNTDIRYTQSRHDHDYDDLIRASAKRHGIDPALVKAIIHTESSFDPYARSPAGAQGLMQLMPSTAQDMGVLNVWDPAQNIEGGVKYLVWLSQRFSDRNQIIAAYNAGHANVRRYGGIPPFKQTKDYVRKVNHRYQTLYAKDTNLTHGGYQLAMSSNLQADTTPQPPTLLPMTNRVYIDIDQVLKSDN